MAPLSMLALVAALSGPSLPAETMRYRFDAARELDDFEAVAGSWSVASGTLWCTSKGAREELRWRRGLAPTGSLKVELVGAGRTAVALRDGRGETIVRIDRGEARVAVETAGRALLERTFEAPVSGVIQLAVAWTLEGLIIRVGDDEPLSVKREADAPPFTQLALLSLRSQPRFDDLVIDRPGGAPAPAAEPGAPSEDERLALERAAALLDAGDADAAFERLATALAAGDRQQQAAARPSDRLLELLQRAATARPALRRKPPLLELCEAARTVAKDGSAEFLAPLGRGFVIETPEIRRIDGHVFRLMLAEPPLAIEVVRYDRKLEYWFGSDPRLVYTSGGGGATLGRARADEQLARRSGAGFVRELGRSETTLGGETTHEYEIAWQEPHDGGKRRSLRELFALHRGDTWCVSIEGTPGSFESARADLDWILATFRFLED